jgi:hypothetical protein
MRKNRIRCLEQKSHVHSVCSDLYFGIWIILCGFLWCDKIKVVFSFVNHLITLTACQSRDFRTCPVSLSKVVVQPSQNWLIEWKYLSKTIPHTHSYINQWPMPCSTYPKFCILRSSQLVTLTWEFNIKILKNNICLKYYSVNNDKDPKKI